MWPGVKVGEISAIGDEAECPRYGRVRKRRRYEVYGINLASHGNSYEAGEDP
jgi:hypothetical protein